jgi:hypothetical protein
VRGGGSLLTQVIGARVIAAAGLAIGWRIHAGPADALAAIGLAQLFGYPFTWAGVCLGMVLRSVEAAQQLGFILFLPLTFISNACVLTQGMPACVPAQGMPACVPAQGMPAWLRVVAGWNPFSAVAAACRRPFGNPDPSALVTPGRCSTPNWRHCSGPARCWCLPPAGRPAVRPQAGLGGTAPVLIFSCQSSPARFRLWWTAV